MDKSKLDLPPRPHPFTVYLPEPIDDFTPPPCSAQSSPPPTWALRSSSSLFALGRARPSFAVRTVASPECRASRFTVAGAVLHGEKQGALRSATRRPRDSDRVPRHCGGSGATSFGHLRTSCGAEGAWKSCGGTCWETRALGMSELRSSP